MITLTKDYGNFTTYLNIDMWYDDEFVPGLYSVDSYFADGDAIYRGNIFDDNGSIIGDYSSDDSTLIDENFITFWDYADDIEASTKINCDTKYGANLCNIGASSSTGNCYIDISGVFKDFFEGNSDTLSMADLQMIYDTLVSDGDVSACGFNSFAEWLQANIDGGLLSECWMSDAQMSDIPPEFGGYGEYDDEEEDYYDPDGWMSDNQLNDIPSDFRDM